MKISWPVSSELDTVPKVIAMLSNCLFPVVGLILFAMLMYGGITRLTAAGDAEKEKESQKILTNAIIGAVIIVLARIIIEVLSSFLGVKLI